MGINAQLYWPGLINDRCMYDTTARVVRIFLCEYLHRLGIGLYKDNPVRLQKG
jgi:hypothetical protein